MLCGLGVPSLWSLWGAVRNRQLYMVRMYCKSCKFFLNISIFFIIYTTYREKKIYAFTVKKKLHDLTIFFCTRVTFFTFRGGQRGGLHFRHNMSGGQSVLRRSIETGSCWGTEPGHIAVCPSDGPLQLATEACADGSRAAYASALWQITKTVETATRSRANRTCALARSRGPTEGMGGWTCFTHPE